MSTDQVMEEWRVKEMRRSAHEICRLQQTNSCVMDERPYRGDCTFENCDVMRSIRDLVSKLDAT